MNLAKRGFIAASVVIALTATPAVAGMNPDAHIAVDMRASDPGRSCATMRDAYPSCRTITPSLSSPGDFDAVIVVYNYTGITAAEFTLGWPADWQIDVIESCADFMIGGDIYQDPTAVALAWTSAQLSAGGTAGIPVAIVRGHANSPGCLAIVPPPEGMQPGVVDAAFQPDTIVESFPGCVDMMAGDPCAFDSTLVASFEAVNPSGWAPLEVTFVDWSRGSPVSWQWNFGDGATSMLRNPHHTYTTCGNYNVSLRVDNGTAVDDTVRSELIHVNQVPDASFAATPVVGCTPLPVQFTDTSVGGPTSWLWEFGDGGVSTLQHPQHTYASTGWYDVRLTVTGPCGPSTRNFPHAIEVQGRSHVGFRADPVAGCTPLEVQFQDNSLDRPIAWHWDFGDGTTSEEQNPLHRYTAHGVYGVSLRVTNECGDTTATISNYIQARAELAADFTGAPLEGCFDMRVDFTATASGDSVTSWSWDFGDGVTSPERNPSHVYTQPGLYTVTLTATAACGQRVVSKPGYVHAVGVPFIDFAATPSIGCGPLDVQFSWGGDPAVTAWSWDFGDGGTSTLRDPLHHYTRAGSFNVGVTVTGACSTGTFVRTAAVVIPGPPPPEQIVLTATRRDGCGARTVQFADSTGLAVNGWLWDFGDGGTSTERNPSHYYASRGAWPVTLTLQTDCGPASRTEPAFIRTDQPAAPAFFNADSICVDDWAHFYNLTPRDSVLSWLWEFGDGATSTEYEPGHRYAGTGTWDVALTVITDCGSRRTLVSHAITTVHTFPPCSSPTPTAIQGPAAAIEAGGVVVRWTVIPPSDYTGYHVQRAIIAAGPYARVTTQPIPDLTRQGRRSYEFRDASAEAGATYYYRLEAIRPGAGSEFFAFAIPVTMPGVMVREAWLGEPSPMPATTRLAVEVGVPPGEAPLSVAVYDSRGRRVRLLAEGSLATGVHRLEWNGADEGGRRMTAGVYFIRLETSGRSWTKKALLVR